MDESLGEAQDLWPPVIADLPEAKMEVEGLRGRILKSGDHWVLFMIADRDVTVPVHHHGAQWGIVLAGEMELTMGDSPVTLRRGDTHYIPANVDHGAFLHAGWQGMYIFNRRTSESQP